MTEHFCTYFDHRYAAKGLAMWMSLKKHCASATLHVLCLNEACREILLGLGLPDVYLHPLKGLEDADPELLKARGNRSLVEYYFTLTPCLPLYLFRTHPDLSALTYVDADLFFFGDPRPILNEVEDHSVGIIEHRFPEDLADLERHGRFNVGWMTFRNDLNALKALETWRAQCIEWCYDRTEPGRFAEQKYLDEWPDRFSGVWIIQHRGANVAPWNLNRHKISWHGEELRIGGEPMLFFHAHGFEPRSPGRPRVLNLKRYGVEETALLIRSIFEPYEEALLEATTKIAAPLALALLSDESRYTVQLLEALKARVLFLDTQLEASEADRAARLDLIHVLEAKLQNSEADRAARLDLIHAFETKLRDSEADRAARLDLIHAFETKLRDSEADRAARLDLIHAFETKLQASEADLDLVRTQLRQAQLRVDAIERSWSWRGTQPVRMLFGLFQKRSPGV